MKKFKGIIAMSCATVIVISAMSTGTFAADIKNNVNDALEVTASDPNKPVDIVLNGSYNYAEFSTTKKYAKIWVNNTGENIGKASIIPIINGVAQEDKAIFVINPVKAYTDNQIYTVNLKDKFPGVTSFRVVVSGNDGFPLTGGMAVRICDTQTLSVTEKSDVITEVAHTYITDDNGEMKVIDFEVSIPADATKQESDEILINAAYAARRKSSVPPLSVSSISYNLLLQEDNFAIPHNTESGVNNNNTVETVSTTVGTSGLAIVLSSITNLKTFNISFKNITNGVMWFDMDRPVNSGRYIYFPNGEENCEGKIFIYNAGKSYQIKLSGTRYDVAGNSSADVSVYEYTE